MDEIRIKLRDDITFGECDELSEHGIFVMENKVYDENCRKSLEFLAICETEEDLKNFNKTNNR